MITVTLEVPSEDDVAELRQKPGYRVVRSAPSTPAKPKLPREPRDWAGMLTPEEAAALRKHTEEVRQEWDRDF